MENFENSNWQTSSYPNHFIVEGSKVDNKTEIANVFNNFFYYYWT